MADELRRLATGGLGLVRHAPYRLPLHCAPREDESLLGLILRHAALYDFPHPLDLFWRLDFPPDMDLIDLCRARPDGDTGCALREALDLSEDRFRSMSLHSEEDGHVAIQGVSVPEHEVRLTTLACCPICLREAPYHRASWLSKTLVTCPRHGIWLFDRCPGPNCGASLSWRHADPTRCGQFPCLFDLRDAPVQEVPARNAATLRQPDFAAGDLRSLARALGDLLADRLALDGRARLDPAAAFASGMAALDTWPTGLQLYLDRYALAGEPRAAMDYGRRYADVWNVLEGHRAEPWHPELAGAFVAHVERRMGVPRGSPRMARWLGTAVG